MTVKINTKDGQIELSDDVIATVVGGSATEIFGVVGMASKSAIRDNVQALCVVKTMPKVLWLRQGIQELLLMSTL